MDTTPSALLVRITHTAGRLEGGSITLDTSADSKIQRELRQNVRSITESIIEQYKLRQPGDTETIEILTGRTANRIERMEGLLNDCRNLLIDLEGDEPPDGEMRKHISAMLDDLTAELGYD